MDNMLVIDQHAFTQLAVRWAKGNTLVLGQEVLGQEFEPVAATSCRGGKPSCFDLAEMDDTEYELHFLGCLPGEGDDTEDEAERALQAEHQQSRATDDSYWDLNVDQQARRLIHPGVGRDATQEPGTTFH